MKYAIALVAAAGMASASLGQNTRLIFEVSATDAPGSYSSSLDRNPGEMAFVRVRAVLVNPTTANNNHGLAGVTFQPVLSNWNAAGGDVRNPFTNDADGSGTADVQGSTGRIIPFASAGQGPASASGLLTSFNDPGNVLRFAGSKATTITTNLAWGVGSAQQPRNLIGTLYNPGQDVVIFKYKITLGGDPSVRTLVASVAVSAIANARGTWYTQDNGLNSTLAPVTDNLIQSASINVVPTPASLALIGLGGLIAGRRRR